MARILIVEDNPDNMKLFRALLTLKGHEVTALQSGDGLREALDQHRPDLVLMDIQLPGKDGFTLASGGSSWMPVMRVVVVGGFGAARRDRRYASDRGCPGINAYG